MAVSSTSNKLPVPPPFASSNDARLWTRDFVLLVLVQFAYGVAFSSFFILPKYLIAALSSDAALVGNAQGAFALAGVLFAPWVGSAIDRFGRRSMLLAGLGLGALSFGGFGFAVAPWAILLLRCLHGLSFAMAFNAGAALAVDLAPERRRAEAIGYFGTAMLCTEALGPWMAEVIAEDLGWPVAFLCSAAFAVLAAVLAARLEVPRTEAPAADQPRGPSVGLLAAYLASSALGVGVGASMTFVPALMVEEGVERVASYFVAFTIGALLQRLVFGWLPDKIGHLTATGLALLAYGIGLLAVYPISAGRLFWVGAGIGVAHGVGYPAISALAISLGTKAMRGRVTAWLTGSFNLGWALCTAGLSPFEARVGYRGLVAVGGSFLLLSAFLVPVVVRKHRSRRGSS